MTDYKKPELIAEIGCNHKGDMKTAKKMIDIAAVYCEADVIKFQKRCNRELLTPEQYEAPHPNPKNSYGSTYGEHREFLEFTLDQHKELKEYCEERGAVYSTSVWDLTSAKEIASIHPKQIKIPSASNTHHEMLDWLCQNYEGEIHISLGMTQRIEEIKIVELFQKYSRNKDLVLYACTSGYPVPFSDVCLLEIKRIKEAYGEVVKKIGFSGHHLGTSVDMAAYALGASAIERHYTLDKTWKGTDHAASLEPDELKSLKQGLREVHEAMTFKRQEMLDIEEVQREKLKYREKRDA